MLSGIWPEWEIVREIGAGSQGAVYMVRRSGGGDGPDDYAAVKVIPISREGTGARGQSGDVRGHWEEPTESGCPAEAVHSVAEAKTMEQLKGHPNIVELQDWRVARDDETGDLFMLLRMELLLPLEEYLGFDVVGLGADICAALSALHDRKLCHLDVKPGNIFVTREGAFKLGDFGTARNVFDMGKGDYPLGTLHYAAPEMLRARRRYCSDVDAVRADVFSLGMVLFELSMWKEYGRECHGPGDNALDREEWFTSQREYEAKNLNLYAHVLHTRGVVKVDNRDEAGETSLKDVIRRAISDAVTRYDSADALREALLSADRMESEGSWGGNAPKDEKAESDPSPSELLDRFIHRDARATLLIKYQSGVHVPFTGNDCVDSPTGVRLAYAGHEPPERICVNGNEVIFAPVDGFVDLSFIQIFRDCTWPLRYNIEARYPDGGVFQWHLEPGAPARHWEWFKRPDWT